MGDWLVKLRRVLIASVMAGSAVSESLPRVEACDGELQQQQLCQPAPFEAILPHAETGHRGPRPIHTWVQAIATTTTTSFNTNPSMRFIQPL